MEAGDVAKADKTVSSSGQFVIRGAKHAERGLVAMQAEELKTDLLRLLAAEDEWKSPVVVNLVGNPGDPRPKQSVVKNLFLTPQGFRLQLDVNLARVLNTSASSTWCRVAALRVDAAGAWRGVGRRAFEDPAVVGRRLARGDPVGGPRRPRVYQAL